MDFKSSTLEHHNIEILSDIMEIPLHHTNDHLASPTDVPSPRIGLRISTALLMSFVNMITSRIYISPVSILSTTISIPGRKPSSSISFTGDLLFSALSTSSVNSYLYIVINASVDCFKLAIHTSFTIFEPNTKKSVTILKYIHFSKFFLHHCVDNLLFLKNT